MGLVWSFASITTPRLRLRRFCDRDVAEFTAYRNRPEIYRYQSWPRPFTDAMAQALVGQMATVEPVRPGEWFQIAIAELVRDELVGDIGLRPGATDISQFEVGFSLTPSVLGQGFMQEALGALLASLGEAGATRMHAVVDARNSPSLRLIRRLGFEHVRDEVGEYFGELCTDQHLTRAL